MYPIPIKTGDVVIQGRTNTFMRHSFNNNNKRGVLEFGIKINKVYTQGPISIGDLETKTLHTSNTTIADVTDRKIYSLSSSVSAQDSRKDQITNVTQRILNISTDPTSEPSLHHQVLGDKLNEFLTTICSLMKETATELRDVNKFLLTHEHSVSGSTQVIPITPNTKSIQVIVPKQVVKKPNETYDEAQLTNRLSLLIKKYDSITGNLNSILSKNQFIN
jgi:hypothetical protein